MESIALAKKGVDVSLRALYVSFIVTVNETYDVRYDYPGKPRWGPA